MAYFDHFCQPSFNNWVMADRTNEGSDVQSISRILADTNLMCMTSFKPIKWRHRMLWHHRSQPGFPALSHLPWPVLQLKMTLLELRSHKASSLLRHKGARWYLLRNHCVPVFAFLGVFVSLTDVTPRNPESAKQSRAEQEWGKAAFCNGSLIVMGRGLLGALRDLFFVWSR